VATLAIVAFGGETWRRRSSVSGAQIALIAAALIAVGAIGLASGTPTEIVDEAFGGQGNEESANERVRLYQEAIEIARERPVLGYGVGAEVQTTRVNSGEDLQTTAHNLVLDMWLRIGFVGVAFIAIALGVTMWTAAAVWRGRAPNETAAIAIAGLLGLTGWLAKALVEPALDKFRLTLLLGFALGFVAASWRAADSSEDVEVAALQARSREVRPAVGGR
jgi:O-antigen ligase